MFDVRSVVQRSRYHPEMRVVYQCHLLNRFQRFEKFLCVKAGNDIVLSLLELFLETFHREPFHAIEVTFDLLLASTCTILCLHGQREVGGCMMKLPGKLTVV